MHRDRTVVQETGGVEVWPVDIPKAYVSVVRRGSDSVGRQDAISLSRGCQIGVGAQIEKRVLDQISALIKGRAVVCDGKAFLMGRIEIFLCEAHAAVESDSDHIVDGVELSVARGNHLLGILRK